MTQIERAQIMYTKFCKDIRLQSYQSQTKSTLKAENFSQTYQIHELIMGYALPKPKGTVRFTLDQQTYLINLFNAGINDKNNRARLGAVAHDMLYHFESDLCLTEAQILAYFSRLTSKQKKEGNKEITPTLKPVSTTTSTSSSDNLKKIKTKIKPVTIPLLNDDQEQELHEKIVLTEKRYKMRTRLVKKIANECKTRVKKKTMMIKLIFHDFLLIK